MCSGGIKLETWDTSSATKMPHLYRQITALFHAFASLLPPSSAYLDCRLFRAMEMFVEHLTQWGLAVD